MKKKNDFVTKKNVICCPFSDHKFVTLALNTDDTAKKFKEM